MGQDIKTNRGVSIATFIGGMVIGIVLTGLIVSIFLPKMMFIVHKSKLGFDETVSTIQANAIDRGCKVPKVYNVQMTLADAGYVGLTKVNVISICQPEKAFEILMSDDRKKFAAMIPCRIGVYQTKNGEVYITEMNLGLLGKMFGGEVAKAMAEVSKIDREVLGDLAD